jgi:hypothetical protein
MTFLHTGKMRSAATSGFSVLNLSGLGLSTNELDSKQVQHTIACLWCKVCVQGFSITHVIHILPEQARRIMLAGKSSEVEMKLV